jgi:ribA/ribD-fused uncharacterized protein
MERALTGNRVLGDLREFVSIRNRDEHAEFEARILAGRIQTKDVADRIKKEIEEISGSPPVEEHRLTYAYEDSLRVSVTGVQHIHKVCTTKSFAKIPALVERKTGYFETGSKVDGKDTLDVPDWYTRFSLKSEREIRKDHNGPVDDPKARIRMIHRISYMVPSKEFRIDFSMVKSRNRGDKLNDVLRMPPLYELEIEYLGGSRDTKDVVESMIRLIERLLGAFQGSTFLLPESRGRQYAEEFRRSDNRFYNLVTLDRRNLRKDRTGNILSGYTVTNKADGERWGLFVSRDRHLLRVNSKGVVVWTGIQAKDDSHADDFLDGEYIPEKNLFLIFDIYRLRTKNVKGLPLFTTDEDIREHPESSRLGCARLFVEDIRTQFVSLPTDNPLRVETKLFLAGDGIRMEEAIAKMFDTKFEYATDGLIFTPRASPVAPMGEVKGRTWTRVYKWKPPHQNSIDFLLRMNDKESVYDPEVKTDCYEGMLFVSRNPGRETVYPCETVTGEYVAPILPADLQRIAVSGARAPGVFQPGAPRDPDAYKIRIPLNSKRQAVDENGNRVENDTLVECSYDVDKRRWTVMRTRYDKTYEYRVLNRPQFGNDADVADNVWTSIHVPVTEEMLRALVSRPPDDTFEDDLYYRDDLDSRDRILKQVYSFHNRVKDGLYKTNIVTGMTLLELAVGRGGDLHKWRKAKPSKVVGIDVSQSNLSMPRQGACARYLNEKQKGIEFLPKVLFIQGDFTKSLEEQHSKYMDILFGVQAANTPYLREFENLKEFDAVACQMAMNYACSSEETFKIFLENVTKHCKNVFFGTTIDGAAVYGLLAGKGKHIFRKNGTVFAQIDKKYEDTGTWTNSFGMEVDVMLESLEKPQVEYLVPFEKVVELFGEAGFELVHSESMQDLYARQNDIVLGTAEQEFSFLYRTFVFRRTAKAEPEEETEVEAVVPVLAEVLGEETKTDGSEETKTDGSEETKTVEPKKRRKRIVPVEQGPPPVFFFSKTPENKEFSNFYEVDFEMDGVKFKSAEHAFQYAKAKKFGDDTIAEKILKAKSAQSAKAFGKKVANFKEEEWTAEKDDLMRKIIRAKFRSNPEITKKLLDTGDRVLAEANPRDRYWGIGTSADTEKAKNPAKWVGENRLGKILMEVREELRGEE